MTWTVYCADVLAWCEEYEGPKFHAVLCDPPYGLTNDRRKGVCNRIARALTDISLPDFDKTYTTILEQADLAGIPLDGSPLSRRKIAMIIKARVSMPESTIDLDDGIMVREPEVNTSSEATKGVTEIVLMNEVDTNNSQFLGDYILDTRDTVDFAIGDILGSDFAEFTAGCFSVPIVPVAMKPFGTPLTIFLQRFVPGFCELIGLRNDTLSKSKASPPILADRGTENTLMLRFDMGRRALELFVTYRASKSNGLAQLGSPKLIRAIPPASGLSAPLKPYRVRFVLPSTDGANSDYFIHIWLHENLWDKLIRIIPQSGFMGKQWDAALPDPEMWRQITRHLHPGGFLMAFASPRTYDQLARDLRDIGMVIHPALVWLNGQSFPKATRIDTQIDKAAGAEREVVGTKLGQPGYSLADNGRTNEVYGNLHNPDGECAIEAPATPLAAAWAGHRYGLQALKPCAEFILVAQKPYEGKPVDCITKTGAGSLWIDGARVATGEDDAIEWCDCDYEAQS